MRGELPTEALVAIVGSRALTRVHAAAIEALVEQMERLGLGLVSGGARGADACAHRAALARGVPQVVVLPTAPERVYPPEHAVLFDAIAASGHSAVVHGARPGVGFSRGLFVSRNRHIVAMAEAVVVAQAHLRSGSMVTGRLALRQEVPSAAFTSSAGGEALVAAGALGLGDAAVDGWQERAAAFLEAVAKGEGSVAPRVWPPHLEWLRALLSDAPSNGRTLDGLGSPLELLCALTEAQGVGLVVEVAPGRYRVADS